MLFPNNCICFPTVEAGFSGCFFGTFAHLTYAQVVSFLQNWNFYLHTVQFCRTYWYKKWDNSYIFGNIVVAFQSLNKEGIFSFFEARPSSCKFLPEGSSAQLFRVFLESGSRNHIRVCTFSQKVQTPKMKTDMNCQCLLLSEILSFLMNADAAISFLWFDGVCVSVIAISPCDFNFPIWWLLRLLTSSSADFFVFFTTFLASKF